jgi:NADH-quinone oxidoreductase subunit M
MVIGGLGAVLTAAYFLVMLSRVTHGVPSVPLPVSAATGPDDHPAARLSADVAAWETPDERPVDPMGQERLAARPEALDIQRYELVAWVPLIVLILLFGLWPKLLLSLTTPAVQTLLGALS